MKRDGRGRMNPFRTAMGSLSILVLLSVLPGCAEQRIRSGADEARAVGDVDRAIQSLEQGLKEHPQSTLLRSGLLQARAEATARRVAQAAALRASGKFDEAQAELQRAQAADPQNPRVEQMLAELAWERRQADALSEAETLADRDPAAAWRVVQQALKDNPRHAGLLSLQRRLEMELRHAQQRAGLGSLAETRPITLDFREAGLRTVLDAVSRHSGINFILDRDIRPDVRVTVFLRHARVEDALDLVIGTNQLAKKVLDSQTIVVYPNTPEKQREYQEQIVRVFHLTSADAKGAAAFLKAMLKIRDPFVDERGNMLALRESAENIQLAERLIALYDAGEPEVLLELEVLEISSTRLTELGVKLPDTFSLTPLNPAGGVGGLTLGNIGGLNRDRIGLGVGGLLINLKREVGDFNTLANPRIRVRNKEKARIMVGDKIPVITATTSSANFISESVNYLDVGLKLDVEPAVFPNDEVAIRVALEVSTLGTAVKTTTGTVAFQIGTRNASTLLRLRDGETQLLAGLISREDRTSASRLPGVGDMPLVGRLFSNQSDDAKRTELVLALTPRVLRNVRMPTAAEAELWVGTDAAPRLRPPVFAPAVASQAASPQSKAVNQAQPPLPAQTAAAAPSRTAPPAPAGPAQQLALRWQGPGELQSGAIAELQLHLQSSVDLRGLPLEIGYDPQKLEWVDASEADYFRRDGAPTSFSQMADRANGRLRLGVLRSQATPVQGDGMVLSLRFKARQPGATEVAVISAQPVALGEAVPAPALPVTLKLEVK